MFSKLDLKSLTLIECKSSPEAKSETADTLSSYHWITFGWQPPFLGVISTNLYQQHSSSTFWRKKDRLVIIFYIFAFIKKYKNPS